MSFGRPKTIAIDHDEYDAKHIGWTADGRQFILTTPFAPAADGDPGNEFVALYLFDGDGALIDAQIDELGPRSNLDRQQARQLYDQRLQQLGEVTFGRIEVAPFSVNRFGIEFGLVVREPGDEYGVWAVEMHPGNYMAFFEPWDSGFYDT